jgi:soluble lytic murein transglycosylase-like protein
MMNRASYLGKGSQRLPFMMILQLPRMVCIGWLFGTAMLLPLSVPPVQAETAGLPAGEWTGHQRAQKARRLTEYLHKTYGVGQTKARTFVQEAVRHGRQHNLKPELILAVIVVESGARERAVSRRGARGLMQIIPRWHGEKIRQIGGSRELFKPHKNISVGTAILAEYLKHHQGNLRKALLHYSGNRANPRSQHPNKVLKAYRKLQRVARSTTGR